MKTKMLIVGIVLAALLVTVSSVSAAVIWTDKEDYQPEEVVYINGSGFTLGPGKYITSMSITRPDGTVDICGPGCVNCSEALPELDANGDFFNYEYDLDGVTGLYIVDVSDGTNSAQTTFTDCFTMRTYESDYTTRRYIFQQGDTVYFNVTALLTWRGHKIQWIKPDGTVLKTSSCFTGVTTKQETYTLTSPDDDLGSWKIKLYSYKSSSCTPAFNPMRDWTLTIRFNVYDDDAILLSPTDDTMIKKSKGNMNFDDSGIHAKWYKLKMWKRRSYLKFDLASIPDTSTITSAKLHLCRNAGHLKSESVGTYFVSNDAWTEGGTWGWNNAPIMGSKADETDVGPNKGGYIWDVTSEVQNELRDDRLSLGLKFTDESPWKHQDFCDKEVSPCSCADKQGPYLEVVYSEDPNIPEFSTIAIPAIAVLGLFLFFNKRKQRK